MKVYGKRELKDTWHVRFRDVRTHGALRAVEVSVPCWSSRRARDTFRVELVNQDTEAWVSLPAMGSFSRGTDVILSFPANGYAARRIFAELKAMADGGGKARIFFPHDDDAHVYARVVASAIDAARKQLLEEV